MLTPATKSKLDITNLTVIRAEQYTKQKTVKVIDEGTEILVLRISTLEGVDVFVNPILQRKEQLESHFIK